MGRKKIRTEQELKEWQHQYYLKKVKVKRHMSAETRKIIAQKNMLRSYSKQATEGKLGQRYEQRINTLTKKLPSCSGLKKHLMEAKIEWLKQEKEKYIERVLDYIKKH